MKLINVTVIKEEEAISGTSSSGNEWQKKIIIVQTQGEYPKKIAVTLWGNMAKMTFDPNKTYTLDIEVESREYNDKWYTDVKCWKAEELKEAPENFPPPPPKEEDLEKDIPDASSDEGLTDDDIPF